MAPFVLFFNQKTRSIRISHQERRKVHFESLLQSNAEEIDSRISFTFSSHHVRRRMVLSSARDESVLSVGCLSIDMSSDRLIILHSVSRQMRRERSISALTSILIDYVCVERRRKAERKKRKNLVITFDYAWCAHDIHLHQWIIYGSVIDTRPPTSTNSWKRARSSQHLSPIGNKIMLDERRKKLIEILQGYMITMSSDPIAVERQELLDCLHLQQSYINRKAERRRGRPTMMCFIGNHSHLIGKWIDK